MPQAAPPYEEGASTEGRHLMELDILAALEGTNAKRGNDRCIIGRWLDNIPETAAGRAELTHAVECSDPVDPNYRTIKQAQQILRRLQMSTSDGTIGDHRAGRCRCAD